MPVWIGTGVDPIVLGDIMSKVAASFMAAGSAGLLWLALLSLGHSRSVATFAALAYGLGTSVWSTASQGLWAHSPTVLAFALAIWLHVRGQSMSSLAAFAIGGLSRPVMLLALPVWVWLSAGAGAGGEKLGRRLTRAIPLSIPAAGFVLAGLSYNVWLTGSALGTAEERNAIWTAQFGARNMWDGNFVEGALGLLVAPSRGLLIYSPIVLLAAIGAWRGFATAGSADHVRLLRAAFVSSVIGYGMYAGYLMWWGGHSYGPRYLTDIMPFLCLLIAAGIERIGSLKTPSTLRRPVRVGLTWGVLGVYSVIIQGIGAFCWPSERDGRIDRAYYESLWHWRRPQILNHLESGPRFDPVGRRLLARFGLAVRASPGTEVN
jgi:hypothetical protein